LFEQATAIVDDYLRYPHRQLFLQRLWLLNTPQHKKLTDKTDLDQELFFQVHGQQFDNLFLLFSLQLRINRPNELKKIVNSCFKVLRNVFEHHVLIKVLNVFSKTLLKNILMKNPFGLLSVKNVHQNFHNIRRKQHEIYHNSQGK
jgi:hypothetical protein